MAIIQKERFAQAGGLFNVEVPKKLQVVALSFRHANATLQER